MKNRMRAPGTTSPASGILNPAGYAPVTLPLPEIILRCNHWDDAVLVDEQCETTSVICNRKSDRDSKCLWVLLPYKSVSEPEPVHLYPVPFYFPSVSYFCLYSQNLKSGTVFIPIGDSDSTFLITAVTAGVVLCGMLFLVVTLIRAKHRLDTELQNQQNSHPTSAHPHAD